jgi:hypothetical protein
LHQATITRAIIITALAGLNHGIHDDRQSAREGKDRAQRELGRLRRKDVEQCEDGLLKLNIARFPGFCNRFLAGCLRPNGFRSKLCGHFITSKKPPPIGGGWMLSRR